MTQAIYDIPVTKIDGQAGNLGAFRGKVLLIVNVASKCGLTPQYEGLQAVYRDKSGQGLEILGFPANNFMNQEPGTEAEIAEFCSANYKVEFPLFSKVNIVGSDKHPLYALLTQVQPQGIGDGPMRERLSKHGITPNSPPEVVWNFEKFLVARDGRVVERFAPDVPADDPRLLAAIDRELAAR